MLCGRATWLPLASRPLPPDSVHGGGALFTEAEASLLSWQPKGRQSLPGWVACVTQRSVYSHSCTHLYASSHTHWREYTHAYTGTRGLWRQTMPGIQMATWSYASLLIFRAHISKVLRCPQGNLAASLPVRCLLPEGGIWVRHQEKPLQPYRL